MIVSHALESIKKICTRGIWINEGKIQIDDKINKVIDEYLKVCG